MSGYTELLNGWQGIEPREMPCVYSLKLPTNRLLTSPHLLTSALLPAWVPPEQNASLAVRRGP